MMIYIVWAYYLRTYGCGKKPQGYEGMLDIGIDIHAGVAPKWIAPS